MVSPDYRKLLLAWKAAFSLQQPKPLYGELSEQQTYLGVCRHPQGNSVPHNFKLRLLLSDKAL